MQGTAAARAVTTQQAYADVERLIVGVVANFHRKFGGDWGELMSDANLAFMQALKGYDPAKAKFTTWCQNTLQFVLRDRLRTHRRPEVPVVHVEDPGALAAAPEPFNLRKFAQNLGPDALTALRVALGADGPPERRKAALVRWLEEAGWCAARIAESFTEIADALVH